MEMTASKKIKRYHGRDFNVKTNLFFEDMMKDVSKGFTLIEFNIKYISKHLEKKNILAYLPAGYISRSRASREFGLNMQVR